MNQEELMALIGDALAAVPTWVREELVSKDAQLRARAEETLAARIAAAIAQHDERQVISAAYAELATAD